jgi:hypothetical protein
MNAVNHPDFGRIALFAVVSIAVNVVIALGSAAVAWGSMAAALVQ